MLFLANFTQIIAVKEKNTENDRTARTGKDSKYLRANLI